jgi:hypothetical protein
MRDTADLHSWIDHVFDHAVSEPEWYWSAECQKWPGDRIQIPAFIAGTFERAGELLARFSDGQLEQGLWYLIGASPGEFAETLVDEKISAATRLRAVRSFLPLFEQVMAVRCTPSLSHVKEQPASPLNGSCYMWWDLLRLKLWKTYPGPQDPAAPQYAPFLAEIVATMRRILAIPHDACRESALHGLGHLSRDYPQYREQFAFIIVEFLTSNNNLRPELTAYAERARLGTVL